MKCPYQTRIIHQPEYTDEYVKRFAEDRTEFCECVKSECPFYYTSLARERCRKAESEVLREG